MSMLHHDRVIESIVKNCLGTDYKISWDSEYSEIERCGGCYRLLGWPSPRASLWAAPVGCPECGRYYFAEGRNEASPRLLASQVAGFQSDFDLPANPDIIETGHLVTNLVGVNRQLHERRRYIRYTINQRVISVPLDQAAHPTQVAQEAKLVDLSATGAKLRVEGAWEAPLVLIDFSSLGLPDVQFMASVQWNQANNGKCEIGCQFMIGPDGRLPLV